MHIEQKRTRQRQHRLFYGKFTSPISFYGKFISPMSNTQKVITFVFAFDQYVVLPLIHNYSAYYDDFEKLDGIFSYKMFL